MLIFFVLLCMPRDSFVHPDLHLVRDDLFVIESDVLLQLVIVLQIILVHDTLLLLVGSVALSRIPVERSQQYFVDIDVLLKYLFHLFL